MMVRVDEVGDGLADVDFRGSVLTCFASEARHRPKKATAAQRKRFGRRVTDCARTTGLVLAGKGEIRLPVSKLAEREIYIGGDPNAIDGRVVPDCGS